MADEDRNKHLDWQLIGYMGSTATYAAPIMRGTLVAVEGGGIVYLQMPIDELLRHGKVPAPAKQPG
jgi:hypothetical protein